MNNDIANELFIMNENTVERLFSLGTDEFVLYSFYYKTKKWQKGANVWATNDYVMKKLHWGLQRVRMAKKVLEDNGMIKQVRVTNDKGQVESWEIKLLYIQGLPTPRLQEVEDEKTTSSPNRLVDIEGQIIYNNNINNINNNKKENVVKESPLPDRQPTTASQFDRFVKWWNEVLIPVEDNKVGNIVKIQVRSQKRIQMFKSRWKETRDYLRAKGKEIDDDAVFKYMTEEVIGGNYLNSDWLRGMVTGSGYQNPYKVEFDNIFSPKMWTGMLEKKYYNRELDRVKYSD